MLFSIHNGLALLAKRPEIALQEGEAKALAEGIGNVARHYEFLAGASAQMVDWTNLVVIASMIYGPRLYNAQKAPERAREPAPDNVTHMSTYSPMDMPLGPH